jgi:hypothetical protein
MHRADTSHIPLANTRFNARAWPREYLDAARVEEFAALYAVDGVAALPPIELIADGEGRFLIADGMHRREAARKAGLRELPAVVLPSTGLDPIAATYLHGLQRSAVSSLPLTRREKRAAIRRLLREQPEASDREIGRPVGVDHKTVGGVRRRLQAPTLLGDGEPGEYVPGPSPESQAKKLFKAFEKAYEARGLGIADFFTGDRTGERLARVLRDVYGERALERAQTFAGWLDNAVAAFENQESG